MKTFLSGSPLRASFRFSKYFLVLLLFSACKCPSNKYEKTPLVTIYSAVKAPMGISFIDINGAALSNVPNVTMTIVDADSMVMSSNGVVLTSAFLPDGILSVGLSPVAKFSPEAPYRFFVRAEAPGYMTVVRSVLVMRDMPNFVPIYMARLDALPAGLSAVEASIAAVSNGTLQGSQTLKVPPLFGQAQLTLRLQDSTRLLCNGKPIESKGPLTYRILMGRPRDSVANRVFPGGFEATDVVTKKGERLAAPDRPIYFTTAGWFSMDMKLGESEVTDFSRPVDVDMPIDPEVSNPVTGKNVAVNDIIPLWSLNNNSGVWTQEGEIKVEAVPGGGLRGRFQISHLSGWNLDFFVGGCPMPGGDIVVNYSATDFPNDGIVHYAEYINAFDNSVMTSTSLLFSGSSSRLNRVPTPSAAAPGILHVHEGPGSTSPVSGLTDPINTCGQTVNLNKLGSAGLPCVQMTFVYIDGLSEEVLCSTGLWHRGDCSGLWDFGGVLDASGNGKVPRKPASGLLGNQCVKLTFTRPVPPGSPAGTLSHTVVLDFNDMNFNTSQNGVTRQYKLYNGLGVDITPAAPNNTFTFDWSVFDIGGISPNCERKIKVTITSGVVTSLGIICS